MENPWNSINKCHLTWSENCVISNATTNQATTLAITDTKLYVPVVTLSTQDNDSRIEHWGYYLPTAKVKDYNIMIDGKNQSKVI